MNLKDSLKLIKLIDKKELIFIGFTIHLCFYRNFFLRFCWLYISRVISKKGDDLFGLV